MKNRRFFFFFPACPGPLFFVFSAYANLFRCAVPSSIFFVFFCTATTCQVILRTLEEVPASVAALATSVDLAVTIDTSGPEPILTSIVTPKKNKPSAVSPPPPSTDQQPPPASWLEFKSEFAR